MVHKAYVSHVEADRVVFLDADTVILNPLHHVWESQNEDVFVRTTARYESTRFDINAWDQMLKHYDVPVGPYMNSGFIVFQNGAHKHIGPPWARYCNQILDGPDRPRDDVHGRRFSDQLSLSMAVLDAQIPYRLMGRQQYGFGWECSLDDSSSYRDVTVYSPGSPLFMEHACQMDAQGDIDLSRPVISSSAHPLYLALQGYRMWHRVKWEWGRVARRRRAKAV